MPILDVYSPAQVLNQLNPADVSSHDIQLLAQGDSWFSLGEIPPFKTSNLLLEMRTTSMRACAINFAYPGRQLAAMADTTTDPTFLSFLVGKNASRWAGVLLSGGGNDLIAALHTDTTVVPAKRILTVASERQGKPSPECYVSEDGWNVFDAHMEDVVKHFLSVRDSGPNTGIPVVMHTYDLATPRPCGAGLGNGPWLMPALQAFGVPESDWIAIATLLLTKLRATLERIASPAVTDGTITVVNTQGTLIPANTSDSGATVDWENEIHPTVQGYTKLAALWTPALDRFAANIKQ